MDGPVVRLLVHVQRKSRARWREVRRLRRQVESLEARLEVATVAAARYRDDAELMIRMCPDRVNAFEMIRTAHEIARLPETGGLL